MDEQRLVAYLMRLSDSPSFPLTVDPPLKTVTVHRQMNNGCEFIASQAIDRLVKEFSYRRL
jgi:hypothetical protein